MRMSAFFAYVATMFSASFLLVPLMLPVSVSKHWEVAAAIGGATGAGIAMASFEGIWQLWNKIDWSLLSRISLWAKTLSVILSVATTVAAIIMRFCFPPQSVITSMALTVLIFPGITALSAFIIAGLSLVKHRNLRAAVEVGVSLLVCVMVLVCAVICLWAGVYGLGCAIVSD
jgi:hypothetical protein